MRSKPTFCLASVAITCCLSTATAQLGIIEAEIPLEAELGPILGGVSGNERGASLGSVGDLDGDGFVEVALGVAQADGSSGRVLILFFNPDGTIASSQQIDSSSGGVLGGLQAGDAFGASLTGVGDINGDGVGDLVVGAPGDDDGGSEQGAIYLLYLNADGSVQNGVKLSQTSGGFPSQQLSSGNFGRGLAALDDLDQDGIPELAVAAQVAGEDGFFVLFVDALGQVLADQAVAENLGGFTGDLDPRDGFADALTRVADLDGDGVDELAVGAPGDDDGGPDRGAVYLLSLAADGSVQSTTKVTGDQVGAQDGDRFGNSLAQLGLLDPDASGDLAVGAPGDSSSGPEQGAVYVVFLQSPADLEDFTTFGSGFGGFVGPLADGDRFGGSLASISDFDGNGVDDLLVGAPGSDLPGTNAGTAWITLLRDSETELDNGTGVNMASLGSGSTPPTIGATWDPVISDGAFAGDKSIVDFLGVSTAPVPVPTFFKDGQELLINVDSPELLACLFTPPGSSFQVPIPDNPSLIGAQLFCQGAQVRSAGTTLTNSAVATIGL